MLTTLDYARIANAVYNIGTPANYVVPAFTPALFEEGMSWGGTNTHFKGCVYVREATREAVVAIQGTVPSKLGDLLADLQIVLGLLPHYCGAADRLLRRTREAYPGYAVSVTGHSLGGGLAQVLGHWTGLPFVSFNAPGMWGDIQKCKFLGGLAVAAGVVPVAGVFGTSNLIRSWEGTMTGPAAGKLRASTGRNFRCVYDGVSAVGMHYGPVTRLYYNGGLLGHSMDRMLNEVSTNARWCDVNPLDPKNKEWGELD